MNRKNPGLVEPETLSKADELHYIRYSAVGWTIAALLYTVYAFWRWGGQ